VPELLVIVPDVAQFRKTSVEKMLGWLLKLLTNELNLQPWKASPSIKATLLGIVKIPLNQMQFAKAPY
jgi:hypothetical protein